MVGSEVGCTEQGASAQKLMSANAETLLLDEDIASWLWEGVETSVEKSSLERQGDNELSLSDMSSKSGLSRKCI